MKFDLAGELLDLIYPPRCVSCGGDAEGELCPTCAAKLDDICAKGACDRCAAPLSGEGSPCPYCSGNGFHPLATIVALGIFADPLKSMIHDAKFHRRWTTAEMLTDRLLEHPPAQRLLAQTDRLVAAPLHWSRHIGRGYNQAQVIAARLSRRRRIPLASPAIRIKNTVSQTRLYSRAKRAKNLQDAFALVNARSIRGKNVVIVDDVTTTHSTLQSLARVLKEAEPASISALVLAVADPRGREFEAI